MEAWAWILIFISAVLLFVAFILIIIPLLSTVQHEESAARDDQTISQNRRVLQTHTPWRRQRRSMLWHKTDRRARLLNSWVESGCLNWQMQKFVQGVTRRKNKGGAAPWGLHYINMPYIQRWSQSERWGRKDRLRIFLCPFIAYRRRFEYQTRIKNKSHAELRVQWFNLANGIDLFLVMIATHHISLKHLLTNLNYISPCAHLTVCVVTTRWNFQRTNTS